MLYTLFLYQTDSGILMYDKSFQDISAGKMELFSSFFSALKTFISEMILKGSKELKNIEMGDYTVLITSIKEINADLVMIADQEDHKTVNKLIPKILKVLIKNRDIFVNWAGNRDEFVVLDQPLSELILAKKQLIGETSLIEKPEDFLKSMWAHKGELPPETIEQLMNEKKIIIENLNETPNVLKKLTFTERLLDISEQLKDGKNFLFYQREVSRLKDEVKDVKLKLKYYLDRIKTSLSDVLDHLGNKSLKDGDYKESYLNLYSFSSKLRLLSSGPDWEKYRDMANNLINKEQIDDHALSETISEILKMREDVEYFIN